MLVVIDGSKALRRRSRRLRVESACAVLPSPQAAERDRPSAQGLANVGRQGDAAGVPVPQREACEEAPPGPRQAASVAPSSASTSLLEGLDETLTLMAMGLPDALQRRLSKTNPIENMMGSIRALTHRVKRWRAGQMFGRWGGVALQKASTRFHRVRCSGGTTNLADVLKRHSERLVSVHLAA